MIAWFRLLWSLILALGVSACVVVPPTVTTVYPDDRPPTRSWPVAANCPTPSRAAGEAVVLLALMNAARDQAGLAALRLDGSLQRVAQAYSCENAARQSLDHFGSDGSDLLERMRRGGLQAALAAENTGIGYGDATSAFQGWMASPPHQKNILRPGVQLVGLGLADGARPVWVLDFLAPG